MDMNWILPSRATQSPLKVANSARFGSIGKQQRLAFTSGSVIESASVWLSKGEQQAHDGSASDDQPADDCNRWTGHSL